MITYDEAAKIAADAVRALEWPHCLVLVSADVYEDGWLFGWKSARVFMGEPEAIVGNWPVFVFSEGGSHYFVKYYHWVEGDRERVLDELRTARIAAGGELAERWFSGS